MWEGFTDKKNKESMSSGYPLAVLRKTVISKVFTRS